MRRKICLESLKIYQQVSAIGLLADDLAILLLLAGARLGYDGRIGSGSDETDEDYTTRLFTYVRSFHPLAQAVFRQQFHPIVNYVGWPLHRSYGPAQEKLYGHEADLIAVDPPVWGRHSVIGRRALE